jgi:CRISPR system Cascade subunit CasB
VNTSTRPHYWQRHTDGHGTWGKPGPAPGADLAALRRGTGREPGSVPAMWPFYTTLDDSGALTARLEAEHLALVLFAVHQQSQPTPVHRDGVGLGQAIFRLKHSGKFSPEAVDRRFAAAATATSLTELSYHVRGLITQLRAVTPQPGLDYTRLFADLRAWKSPDGQARVRRRWGSQYFAPAPHPAETTT